MSPAPSLLAQRLIDWISRYERVFVAFSGGVDSSVVAAASYRALGDRSTAVTALSPSVASWQRKSAAQVAQQIGISHQWIETSEVDSDEYRRNDSQRCFFCKQTLYGTLWKSIGAMAGSAAVLSGTNADDLGDYRPGLKAGRNAGVLTPMADLGMTKSDVRAIAAFFQLPNDQMPASPCLASRIAYGVEVTRERLTRIDASEAWLRSRGFGDLRVRLLQEPGATEDIANEEVGKVEVPLTEMTKLHEIATEMTAAFIGYGFDRVTIDSLGLRSGNMNEALLDLVPIGIAVQVTQASAERDV